MKKAFLGIDLGGTAVKAGVFDESGTMLGFSRKTWPLLKKEKGFFEVPVEKILKAAREAVSESVSESKHLISAVSVASQGQTFVSIDKKGRPLHDAILWYDSRAKNQAEKLKRKIPGEAGKNISRICTAAKILWLRENRPEAEKNASKHLLLADLLNYHLTGTPATDPNTASSSGLYSYSQNGYDRRALEAAQIPGARLSDVIPTGIIIGKTTPAAEKEWGLNRGVPVISGTNDQYAGALGAGNCRPGIITETTGTCMAVVTLTEKLSSPLPEGLFAGKFPIEKYYYLLSYSKTAGIVLDWFNNELCGGADFKKTEKSAAAVPPGSSGVFVMPDFDGSVSPSPNPDMKGAFLNMSLETSRSEIFRAVLEALGYSLREKITHLQKTGIRFHAVRAAGGGAKSGLWLQIKADIINFPLEKPLITETAALGAAVIAAAGTGCFKTLEEAAENLYNSGKTFYPDKEAWRIYSRSFKDYSRFKQKIFECYKQPKGAPQCKKH